MDSNLIDSNLKILNYTIIIHNKTSENYKMRLIALVSEDIYNDIAIRRDLDIENYPVISLELTVKNQKKIVISGIYRTWSKSQKNDLDEICSVFDTIGDEDKLFIGIGDINLDKSRFEEENYPYPRLRDKLLGTISKNDIRMSNLPLTYKSKSNNS